MIKKILFSLFISFVGLISFSSAGQIFITNGEYTTNDNLHYDFTFQNGNNFLANGEYRVFSVFSDQYYPSAYPRFYNVFWTDNGLYVIQTCQGGYECSNIHTAIQQQGYINSYCKTTYSLNCTDQNISIEGFIGNDNYKNPSSFTLHDAGQNLNFCFDYEDLNESLCFNAGVYYGLSNSLGFSYNPFPSELGTSADTISSYFKLSPRGLPSNIVVDEEAGGIELGSDQSAINYFETRYGRDKNICYVGIDNLTDLWGSSVSFQSGTGLNIFEVYSGTYGTPELNKVYVWLNTWLINYEQWFYRETPLYLASYNSGTNAIDLYYNDLTFPFSGNPVAYYFMSDNIESYSPYSTMGSSVVSYCNLKINNGSFDQIIDQADKNNINNYTEQSNKNNGLNPDGTKNTIDYSQFGIYTGDAWVSSGIDIDFSGDTTLKSSIRNFFERIDVLFGDTIETENNNTRKGSRSVGSILPSYIVYGLLFVVLFKFLRRR